MEKLAQFDCLVQPDKVEMARSRIRACELSQLKTYMLVDTQTSRRDKLVHLTINPRDEKQYN